MTNEYSGDQYRALIDTAYFYYKALNHQKSYEFNYKAGIEAYKRRDIDESKQCFIRAIEDAEALNDNIQDRKSDIQWRLGIIYIEMNMPEKAQDLFCQSIQYFKEHNKGRAAEIMWLIAGACKINGNYEIACTLLRESLQIWENLNNQYMISRVLHDIGIMQEYKDDYAGALISFNRSLAIREMADSEGIPWGLCERGKTYGRMGEYSKALSDLGESRRIFESSRDLRGLATACRREGYVYYRKGDLRRAMESYEKSIEIYDNQSDLLGKASLLQRMGLIHQIWGDYERSLNNFDEALEIRLSLGDKRGISDSIECKALIFRSIKKYEMALDLYEDSLKKKVDLGDRRGIARVYYGKASAYLGLEDHGMAEMLFKLSLIQCEDIKYNHGKVLASFGLGLVNRIKGNYQEGLDLLNKCLIIQKDLGEKLEAADTCAEIGYIYADIGDDGKALKCLEEALDFFKDIKAEPRRVKAERYRKVLLDKIGNG